MLDVYLKEGRSQLFVLSTFILTSSMFWAGGHCLILLMIYHSNVLTRKNIDLPPTEVVGH